MKSKKIIVFLIITNIILIGIICSFICKNVNIIIKEKQITKEMTQIEYDNSITELNKSHETYAVQIQNNKRKLASAITEMGVETSEQENIEVMVNNIMNIKNNLINNDNWKSSGSGTVINSTVGSYMILAINTYKEFPCLATSGTELIAHLIDNYGGRVIVVDLVKVTSEIINLENAYTNYYELTK